MSVCCYCQGGYSGAATEICHETQHDFGPIIGRFSFAQLCHVGRTLAPQYPWGECPNAQCPFNDDQFCGLVDTRCEGNAGGLISILLSRGREYPAPVACVTSLCCYCDAGGSSTATCANAAYDVPVQGARQRLSLRSICVLAKELLPNVPWESGCNVATVLPPSTTATASAGGSQTSASSGADSDDGMSSALIVVVVVIVLVVVYALGGLFIRRRPDSTMAKMYRRLASRTDPLPPVHFNNPHYGGATAIANPLYDIAEEVGEGELGYMEISPGPGGVEDL